MAAPGAVSVGDFITRAEARAEIGTLVSDQLAAFESQRQSMADLEPRATSLIDSLAQQADEALKRNQLASEAQITQQVGALRPQAVSTVTTVEGKFAEMKSVIDSHTSMQQGAAADLAEQVDSMKKLKEQLQAFGGEVESNMNVIKNGVISTQGEVACTQSGIQGLIDGARSDGGSTLFRSGAQERGRPVFDPRDYKLDALAATLSLGAWKKWKHEPL